MQVNHFPTFLLTLLYNLGVVKITRGTKGGQHGNQKILEIIKLIVKHVLAAFLRLFQATSFNRMISLIETRTATLNFRALRFKPLFAFSISLDWGSRALGEVFQSIFYHVNRIQMTPKNEQDFQHVRSQHVEQLRVIYFRGKHFFRGSFGKLFFPLDHSTAASEIHLSFSIWKIIFHSFSSARKILRQLPVFADG